MSRSTTFVLALGLMFVAPVASNAMNLGTMNLGGRFNERPPIPPRTSSLPPIPPRTSSLPPVDVTKPLPPRPAPKAFPPSSSYRGPVQAGGPHQAHFEGEVDNSPDEEGAGLR